MVGGTSFEVEHISCCCHKLNFDYCRNAKIAAKTHNYITKIVIS